MKTKKLWLENDGKTITPFTILNKNLDSSFYTCDTQIYGFPSMYKQEMLSVF